MTKGGTRICSFMHETWVSSANHGALGISPFSFLDLLPFQRVNQGVIRYGAEYAALICACRID
jgi:hypothetical protein